MIPNKSQLPFACSASLQPWFPQSPFHRHCCSFIAQPHPQPVAAAWASSTHPSPISRTLPCRCRHCRFASSCCYEASLQPHSRASLLLVPGAACHHPAVRNLSLRCRCIRRWHDGFSLVLLAAKLWWPVISNGGWERRQETGETTESLGGERE